MKKEVIICIVIVILVIVGNIVTQNYTNKCVAVASESLNELREELLKDDVNLEFAKEKVDDIYSDWSDRHNKLAYYVEHDELEKVKTDLTGLKGYIETEEYSEAVPELDRTVFVLEHIKDKTALNLKNLF